MAKPVIIIPPINPLRFTEQGGSSDPGAAFDLVPQSLAMQSWQRGVCPYYIQPFGINDQTALQLSTSQNINNDIYLELWEVRPDGQSKLLVTGGGTPTRLYPTLSQNVPGDTYDAHGTISPIPMRRHQWDLNLNTILATIDYAVTPYYLYYFVLTSPAVGGFLDLRVMQSEPMRFLATTEEKAPTLFIAYKHPVNDLGIFWEMNPLFGLRADGFRGKLQTDANYSTYENQTTALRNLDRRAKRIWPFIFGGNSELIVDWVQDRLNRLFDCKDVRINGVRYVADEGSQFEVDLPLAHGLKFSATLTVREYWPEDAGLFVP